MAKLNVLVDVQNMDELKQLLRKANDQTEQLQKTLKQISEFKPVIKQS